MKRWICLLKIWIGIHIIVLGITMWIFCWGLWQNILCEEYGRLENNASTFIGSLLTIWTVLAAALIFYMEKKEIKLRGIRNWDILTYGISQTVRRWTVAALFSELFLALFLQIIYVRFILPLLGALIFLTLLLVFGIVFEATNEVFIENKLREIIKKEFEKPNAAENSVIIKKFCASFRDASEDNLDFLISILVDIFLNIKREGFSHEENIYYIYESLYVRNVKNKELFMIFTENLIDSIMKKENTEEKKIRLITPVIFCLIEKLEGKITECIGIIDDKDVRNTILLRSFVYSLHLAQKKRDYNVLKEQLEELLQNIEHIGEREFLYCQRFEKKLNTFFSMCYRKKRIDIGSETSDFRVSLALTWKNMQGVRVNYEE